MGSLSAKKQQANKMLRDNFRSLVLPIKQRFGQAKNAPQMTLSEVLSNQSSVNEFREFLRKEFSQENLDFIIDVDQLLSSYSHDKAFIIFQKFLALGTDNEVNLCVQQRHLLLDALEGREVSRSIRLFQQARREIFVLIERDPFARYR